MNKTLLRLRFYLLAAAMIAAYAALPAVTVFAEGEEAITPPATVVSEPESSPPILPQETATSVEPVPDPVPLEVPPTPTPTSEVTPGPQEPVGPSAKTYTFNEATGLWENDYYTWDPVTKQTKPKTAPDYSYNPETKHWDTTEWIYNPTTGKYQENIVSTPAPTLTPQEQELIETMPGVQGDLLRALLLPSPSQGPQNASTINGTSSATGIYDLFHNASISNTITSQAATGDAAVVGNTIGGNATSGNAQTIANVINALNSSLGFLQSNPLMFIANIAGDVLGDLLIDPGQLPGASSQQLSDSTLTVNRQTNNAILNNIDLSSSSGAATVASNTQAGSATTGNAYAMANVVNVINSAVGSGQSFMGMINVYGNFNGDILLPPGFMNSLLASNAQAPDTTVIATDAYNTNIDATNTSNTELTVTDTTAINNNIAVTAATGGALVANNTNAGNATTGNAETNVTLFNLVGKQLNAKNAMLVFVNVLGNWVGLIVDAPTGATAGLLSDAESFTGSQNSTVSVQSTTNNYIENNMRINANTGEATVANNTSAGNATSGNAYAAANVLNISNSSFNLSDWFGILFINVLGNWYGSFGVDTDAGNPLLTPAAASPSGTVPAQAFRFVPTTNASSNSATYASVARAVTEPAVSEPQATSQAKKPATLVAGISSSQGGGGINTPLLMLSLIAIIAILFGDRIVALIRNRQIA